MISEEQYEVLFHVALNLTIDQWLEPEEIGNTIFHQENVKAAKDALHNVWTDDIIKASVWSERALERLTGK